MKILRLQSSIFFSFLLLFSSTSVRGQTPPGWNVNPADFQFSANITALLYVDYELAEGDTNLVGAFVNDTCRGVATATYALDTYLYFLTVYSNATEEEIHFRAYIASQDTILDVAEVLQFTPNGIYGDPEDPFVWNAILTFDHPPSVAGVQDQTIEVGNSFTAFDLDDYLTEQDGDSVTWGFSGNVDLIVAIDANNLTTVTPPDDQWTGSEEIIFTATDVTDSAFSGSDTALFTILPLDNPPQVGAIPDQTIGFLGSFAPIHLTDYLIEVDGDSITWDYAFQPPAETDTAPAWSVQPSDYQNTMTVTARVVSRGVVAGSSNYILAAFVNDSVRGVTSAVEALGEWLYFLTVYSNTNGEEVTFKVYDDSSLQVLPVLQRLVFTANEAYGDPENPLPLQAGFILLEIEDQVANLTIVDSTWTGSETVEFNATDFGTLHNYSDSAAATFTILPDYTPLVSGIPDQTIEQGDVFATFDLDDFLTEFDGQPVAWSYGGNQELIVTIDGDNIATIAPPNNEWIGSESIVFTATDVTDNAFSGSDAALFTVLALDHPPEVSAIPDQTIGFLGNFTPLPLDDYLVELDGDSVGWSYIFEPPSQTDTIPDWSVQPSDFELTMTVTARVFSQGHVADSSEHLLAAFVGDSVRGVASAISALGEWLYFLTVYSSANGENVTFKFYDNDADLVLPVPQQLVFTANEAIGDPENPFELQAGHLLINIDVDHLTTVDIVDDTWAGSETVQFIATDYGTLHNYSDSTSVTFTIIPDHTPLVAGIPDQTIEQEGSFDSFDLDDYLTEIDGESILWSYSGNQDLIISIDADNYASVAPPNTGWTGSEAIIFTATDNTTNAFSGSDTAQFTVLPLDHAPQVSTIPNDTIGIGGLFEPLYLDDYLIEQDGDEYQWNYAFAPYGDVQDPPVWTVQPQDYQYTMNVTGAVTIREVASDTTANILAAFVNDTCRGVAEPVFELGQWLYFLTIYGNTNGDSIDFRIYHQEFGNVVSIVERVEFVSNDVIGSPEDPFPMNATNLSITIDSSHVAEIVPVSWSWSGTEAAYFIARDLGTPHQYADSTLVLFTVLPDPSPIVADIPNQIIDEGQLFTPLDLDHYLVQPDTGQVTWSYSGQQELIVNINTENVASVDIPHEDWFGSETIRFTATDNSDPVLQGWNEVEFVVNNVNDAPVAMELEIVTVEDTPVDIVLAGSDVEDDSLTFSVLAGPFFGIYVNGTYTPESNYNGVDSLSYLTNDGELDSEPATVSITVRSINDWPLLEMPLPDVSIDEDDFGAVILPRLEDHFADIDEGDHLTFSAVALDAGLDSIRIGVLNGTSFNDILVKNGRGILSVKRYMLYDARSIKKKSSKEIRSKPSVLTSPITPFINGYLNLLRSSTGKHRDPYNGVGDTTSLVVFPTENFNGDIRIVVNAKDDSLASIGDTLLLSVLPLNDPPLLAAIPDTSVNEDDSLSLAIIAYDVDGDSIFYSAESDTLAVLINVTGNILKINLRENWNGVANISVRSADALTVVSTDFTLQVRPVNDIPYFTSVPVEEATQDVEYRYTMTAEDIDNDDLTFVADSLPEWLFLAGITTLIGTPTNADVGSHYVSVSVTDSIADPVAQSFTIAVANVDDPPVAYAGLDQTAYEGMEVTLDGTGSVDPDGLTITYDWTAPAGITLSDSTTANPTFTAPDVDESTSYNFTLQVNDGELDSDVDTVVITVIPVAFEELPDFTEEPQNLGEVITISVTLPEWFMVDTISLYFIQGGEADFQGVPMTAVVRTGTYSADIPGAAVSYSGLAYFIRAVDIDANSITTDTLSIPVVIPADTITSQIENSAFPNDFPLKKWRIISVPTELDDPSVSNIFNAAFNQEPGKKTWKLYHWTGLEWALATAVTPGEGYWLQQRVMDRAYFSAGSGVSVDITGTGVPVQPGWNLVSSPYSFPVDVNVDQELFSGPYTYGDFDGEGWLAGITQFQPWGGYALYNWSDSAQTLDLLPLSNTGNRAKETAITEGWKLQLMAVGDTYADQANYIGQLTGARDARDGYDLPEPPYIEGYVSLSMERPEWGERITRFTTDIRSFDEEVGIWDINLRTKGETGSITLASQLRGEYPAGHELWLLDITTREAGNLLIEKEIIITTYNERFPNRYKVVSGPADRIDKIIHEIWAVIPQRFALLPNYPNPFNPVTTIQYILKDPAQVKLTIYDLLGREITTLVNGIRDMGNRTVIWDGTNARGLKVSAGIYLYRIDIKSLVKNEHFSQIRKMILLK